MFENITYKKKFLVLIVLLIVLAITGYKRSFSLTIDAYDNLRSSRLKLSEVSNSRQKIVALKNEVAYLDLVIGKEAANADVVQQEILNTFNQIENGSDLVKLEEIHMANNDYFNIYTNQLILSGGYKDLLEATYQYEKEFDYSRVVSLKFFVEKEPRSRRKKLFEQLIFQNYEKIK
ncbi:hypothetical protein [Ulvibacterium marinum]|uniref:Uncharacterized protein n=1 Tax=Ulvibacterium marinum TaxID=2419782 RepID=A0A3B0BWW5_9FLAO|nr:hypothetical protein [Ulvibacterium marinum]RKN76838.1 hypothetical protein D7Z94_23945 [Ulvibacterium marinum]